MPLKCPRKLALGVISWIRSSSAQQLYCERPQTQVTRLTCGIQLQPSRAKQAAAVADMQA